MYIGLVSEEQQQVYRRISDRADVLLDHLIKTLLFPHALEVNHWKQEIFSFVNDVPKLRNNKKFPRKKLILQALSIYNDAVEAHVERVVLDEHDLNPVTTDAAYVLICVEEYQNWLASELSERGYVRSADVYRKIDEIIERSK